MNPHLLILRLTGVLQSWGIRSKWDVRDTAEVPTKSAIIGLLACAGGIHRFDPILEKMDQSLQVGFRVEMPGRIIRDFQTIHGVLPTAENKQKGSSDDPSTIISPREYLADAEFLAVVGGDPEMVAWSFHALQNPVWPIYLGRKSCVPTVPILEAYTQDFATIEEALSLYPWSSCLEEVMKEKPKQLQCYLEDPKGESQRMDRIRVNPARMYSYRTERTYFVPTPTHGQGR